MWGAGPQPSRGGATGGSGRGRRGRQAGGRRERGLYYLGFSGGASSSQSRRRSFSFALRATHPGWLPARRRGGAKEGGPESRKERPAFTPTPTPLLPTQTKPPDSKSRIRYLPGAPGPSVTASPAGRAWYGSRSPGLTKWSPPAG